MILSLITKLCTQMGINNNKHYLLNDFENSFFPFYIKFILNNILYFK